jgi:hypothetical protein
MWRAVSELHGYYFLSMRYLAERARNPAMKKRASMTIEYLTADFAPRRCCDEVSRDAAHSGFSKADGDGRAVRRHRAMLPV